MAFFADPSKTLLQLMQAVVSQRLFEHPILQTLSPSSTREVEPKGRAPRATHPSGAGRRRDIARCRVLRATISKFEDAFQTQSGRKPLGSDREPLKDIYLEYKVLKQQIRGALMSEWNGNTSIVCDVPCVLQTMRRPTFRPSGGASASEDELCRPNQPVIVSTPRGRFRCALLGLHGGGYWSVSSSLLLDPGARPLCIIRRR